MASSEIFISTDIEADGPIPGDYSMVSFGACIVGRTERKFYRELKPVSPTWSPEALAVSGLSREHLLANGTDPLQAMADFNAWILSETRGARPVFVAFNATFDWMFVHWYFHHFLGKNPFGISGLDVKAFYMGALRKKRWTDTTKRNFEKRFLSNRPHTHNALDDAIEQAEIFQKVYDALHGEGSLVTSLPPLPG